MSELDDLEDIASQFRYGCGKTGRVRTRRQRAAYRRATIHGAAANRDKTLERSISRIDARIVVAKKENQK